MAHGLRMVANLVILKMIAVMLGPVGMGGLGNFMSLTTMISVFSGGGIATGITKYVAEYQKSPRRLIKFIGTAFAFGFLYSAIFFVGSIVFSAKLSVVLFGSSDFIWLMPTIGLAQLICFFGTAVIAIVNGQRRQDLFALITLVAYFLAIPISFVLIYTFELDGAAIALLVVASATGIPAVFLVMRSRLTPLIRIRFNSADTKKLSRFAIMLLASAVLFPISEIFIRTMVIELLGKNEAGLWQALSKLSGAYLGFFTLYLSVSYMPQLSALSDRSLISQAVGQMIIKIGAVFAFFGAGLFIVKDFVVTLLFSIDFLNMTPLFIWQLLGDFFRLSAYVIGFLGVAKAAFRMYIACEVLQVFLQMFFAYLTLNKGGSLVELVQSYALAYFIYFLVMLFAFFKYYRGRFDFFR
jgi:O-antigen/teichoic acid export membrane protein